MKKFALKSYRVVLFDDENYSRTITTTSPGKARYDYYMDIRDCYDMTFFEFIKKSKVYSNGLPYTSPEFIQNAIYRRIPFAKCGMMVKGEGLIGYIVGHNSSANLDVLVTEGQYKGGVVNMHPNSNVQYFNQNGNLIAHYKDGNLI